MNTIALLSSEHTAILQVLEQVELAASALERGVPVPVDIFQDIQEFFTIFVDRCHHEKEEAEIFPRLAQDHGALIKRLETEHVAGRQYAKAFSQAVQTYQPGEMATGAALAAAARVYAAFLRKHIVQETQELFPVVVHALEADDQHLMTAFDRIEVERIGPGTHERLHGMIDGLEGRIAPLLALR